MRLTIWITALALVLAAASAPALAQESCPTAREIFAMLPESIFENTVEGLSPSEKQNLLARGHSEFWEVAGETEDVLVLAALPFHDTAVALRLFRNQTDGFIMAAVGTLGGPVCTMELWHIDRSGRAVPADTPQEPDIAEFLGQEQKLPPDVNPTVMICLGLGGLRAQPLFWTSSGMAHVPLANDISFQWNGKAFEKHISPHGEQVR